MADQGDNEQPMPFSRFEWTGALPILDHKKMLDVPKKILRRTLMYIYDIASLEAAEERDLTEKEYESRLVQRRPHQVFLLDGARGSGKTTLLLTIQRYLEYLGNTVFWTRGSDQDKKIVEFLEHAAKTIEEEIPCPPGKAKPSGYFQTPLKPKSGGRVAACVLPVLYPSDLEFSQSIMEGIIALMSNKLDEHLKVLEDKSDTGSLSQKKVANDLKKQLIEDVAAGWFLSNNVGMDAVLRDSADYKDFLNTRGKTNSVSFARVLRWRKFINDFLNHFGCELLAVFFDDTDLGITITKDILHTIRIFLDHPRIVTVIAGNLRSMRQSLLLDEMKSLRGAMRSLNRETESIASEWRRFARQQIEESLEKVLPRQFRMSIAPTTRDASDGDFSKILGVDLDRFCGDMQDKYRDNFLIGKHEAHFRWLEDRQERKARRGADTNTLENYLAWWIFRHSYREQLRPRSARHMAALHAFTVTNNKSIAAADLLESEHRKRLAVILFESPENYEIIHRLNDYDVRILDWLRRHRVESTWRGNRLITINGQPINENTYSYSALCFRADLDLAMPIHENRDAAVHPGLLPTPAGHNLIAYRPFFERNARPHLFGVADAFRHSLVPGNCLYFSDIAALPDVAWRTPGSDYDPWGHRLIYDWPKQFFFYVDELHEKDHKQHLSINRQPLVPEAWIKDYFVKTVIPMASVSIGRFIKPTDDTAISDKDSCTQIADRTLLDAETRDGNNWFFETKIEEIEALIRRFDYLEDVARGPSGSVTIQKMGNELLEHWHKAILNLVFEERPSTEPDATAGRLSNNLSSYQWLLNDVRRAWHAARIFLNQSSETFKKRSARNPNDRDETGLPEVTSKDFFSHEDRYIVGTRAAFDRWLYRSPTMETFLRRFKTTHDALNLNIPGVVRDGGGYYVMDKKGMKGQILKDLAAVVSFGAAGVSIDPHRLKAANSNSPYELSEAEIKPLQGAGINPFIDNPFETPGQNTKLWPFSSSHLDPGIYIDDRYKETTSDPKHNEKRKRLHQTVFEVRTNFRLGRSFLLFLFGVAPTVPSLIHIEIAAILKHSGNTNNNHMTPEEHLALADTALNDWTNMIWSYLNFVQEYRRVLELAKIRLDIMHLQRESDRVSSENDAKKEKVNLRKHLPSNCGVAMTMLPDMSYDLLGVEGLIALPLDIADETQKKALKRARDGKEALDQRTKWSPIFDDVTNNLAEAMNFISVTRATLDGIRAKRSGAAAATSGDANGGTS